MDIRQADPDLESIARRLEDGEIDLQPDFQRQEVWTRSKKQKLIDTILRGWAVPPIHLVQHGDYEDVLDGQQRLTAIRDFHLDRFPINGDIPPENFEIEKLNGLYYSHLPDSVRRRFDRYTLRVYTIFNALPQETAELFYRLNQPTALTSGEQRNALFGTRRSQMKEIVSRMGERGINLQSVGFSNSRLAYDDVIARTLVVLERGTLRDKIGEAEISNAFRNETAFHHEIFDWVRSAVDLLAMACAIDAARLNKATVFSLLIAIVRFQIRDVDGLLLVMRFFAKGGLELGAGSDVPAVYRQIFLDRASSRVTDVSSVVLRDYCIARCVLDISRSDPPGGLQRFIPEINAIEGQQFYPFDAEEIIAKVLESSWGVTL